MRRIPILPTLLVALAVAAMIGLGLWQLLIRLPEKEAQLRQLAANPTRPSLSFPPVPDDALLFRRASGICVQPVAIRLAGAGQAGYRAIADCRTGAEDDPARRAPGTAAVRRGRSAPDHGMIVQLGTTRDPNAKVAWRGGEVRGYLSHAPDPRPLIATIFDHSPKRLMLVADTPPPGLARNNPPDISAVPNNHLAYAGQWFFFAAVASVIYVLALRRRSTQGPPSPRP